MDSETLLYLLRGGHISVPDRIARGLWPHSPMKISDLQHTLAEVFEATDFFPQPFPGREQLLGDGAIFERGVDGSFLVHVFASDPIRPTVVRHYIRKHFATSEDAAIEYLRCALNLPGNLDGWVVEA